MLTVCKLHHFSVTCSSTNKSWWMGDGYLPDQFGITVLHFIGSEYDAKIPECKINLSQSSWSCWHQPWGMGERMVGGGSTWKHCAKCFTLHGAGNPTALLGTAPVCGASLGLALSELALQQPGAWEWRVSAGSSLAKPKPNLCQVQLFVHLASGVLQYQGDPSPVFPQLMGS